MTHDLKKKKKINYCLFAVYVFYFTRVLFILPILEKKTAIQLLKLTTKNSSRNAYYHDKIIKMQLFIADILKKHRCKFKKKKYGSVQ